ncbi:hypothetical protein SDC9_21384 [bioreactor metagenome]|uniref:Uncharacterized protein n=1 Tax=bioreactor metagenome TaxID=1076179 RepID=A0A644U9D8_9ZZZZ
MRRRREPRQIGQLDAVAEGDNGPLRHLLLLEHVQDQVLGPEEIFEMADDAIVVDPVEGVTLLQELLEGAMAQRRVPLPLDVLEVPAFQPEVLTPHRIDDLDVETFGEGHQCAQIPTHADIFIAQHQRVDVLGLIVRPAAQADGNIPRLVPTREDLVHQADMPGHPKRVENSLLFQRLEILMHKLLDGGRCRTMAADMQEKFPLHGSSF